MTHTHIHTHTPKLQTSLQTTTTYNNLYNENNKSIMLITAGGSTLVGRKCPVNKCYYRPLEAGKSILS